MYQISLPYPSKPDITQRVTLDGVDYLLRLRWNPRGGWYLGLSDAATEEPIFSPVKMRVQWDFLLNITDERCPPGMLIAYDQSNALVPPGYNDLGGRVILVYVPVAELA